jgi:hypothetical protein
MNKWPSEEVGKLIELSSVGMSAILAALPHRTRASIFTKASKLGISIIKETEYDRNGDEFTNKKWIWENRIKPFLALNGECLEWNGAGSNGYGQIRFFVMGVNRIFNTHKISMEVALGKLSSQDEWALHSCDNPKCCNPAHLFPGTQKDNMMDCKSKGRIKGTFKPGHVSPVTVRGEGKRFAKMTDAGVREARAIYDSGLMGHKLLAKKFSVSPRTMQLIVKRLGWKHVT